LLTGVVPPEVVEGVGVEASGVQPTVDINKPVTIKDEVTIRNLNEKLIV
jgi:hypothetical protein